MKQVLLLYRFNPYHNRIIKKFDTTAEYIAAAGSYLSCEYPKNFAYRDGVTTSMRVKLDDIKETPDYLLILTDSTTPTIESRWFIMDADITSGTVCTMGLRRDVMADYYDDVINAPAFIEKATLNPSDPFIFNTENITVNKIKKGETLLQDASKCAWVVGYLASNITATTVDSQEAVEVIAGYSDAADFNSHFPLKDYVYFDSNSAGLPITSSSHENVFRNVEINLHLTRTNYVESGIPGLKPYGGVVYKILADGDVNLTSYATYNSLSELEQPYAPFNTSILGTWGTVVENRIKNDFIAVSDDLKTAVCSYFNYSNEVTTLAPYVNQKIKIGNDYYQLMLDADPYGSGNRQYFGTNENNGIVNSLKAMSCWDSVDSVASTGQPIDLLAAYDFYRLHAVKITSAQLTIDIDPLKSRECAKLPYRMFAIPYSTTDSIKIRHGTSLVYDTIMMSKDLALSVAKAISVKFTGANVLYDIQLLPYCPAPEIIVGDHDIVMPKNNTITTLIKDGNDVTIGALYWCAANGASFDITKQITVDNVKLESITDQYRLSSPNWNGQFEFNAAKNGGVSKFNVDITYKPHTPYIHINPDFGRLYGQDYDDARGLLCYGDFSLPQTSVAWNTYEIQNKNYQNQFQRDIQNLELTQSIQMKQQKFNAITGAVSGAVSGATTGAMLGGVGGAVAGGLIGAGASVAGAAMDIKYQKQLNEEAIDYRQDQFGFQLENIRALPQNLTNVGGLTANNKIFPVLEYYSCTDEEKQALTDKLYYNGMTVDRISTIAAFLQPQESYIKGKLIRITIDEDNHFIEAIANELDRGVFIK